jgi:hypothetical protein
MSWQDALAVALYSERVDRALNNAWEAYDEIAKVVPVDSAAMAYARNAMPQQVHVSRTAPPPAPKDRLRNCTVCHWDFVQPAATTSYNVRLGKRQGSTIALANASHEQVTEYLRNNVGIYEVRPIVSSTALCEWCVELHKARIDTPRRRTWKDHIRADARVVAAMAAYIGIFIIILRVWG